MDNATFHPKKHLDERSIASGHYFLPLPPYSPELNPIEQFWATLKRKVTELLRRRKIPLYVHLPHHSSNEILGCDGLR